MPYVPKLKAYRLELGWSQAELARRAGIDRATVARCENEYFVNEVSCANMVRVVREDAKTKRILLDGLAINPGGKPGGMPKKGQKRIVPP
jgi:DNA-binding XRE family transcriptional regulator